MPAPCTTDWPAIRATAIALNSIKEAAARHSVPYTAAKKRASREQWPVGRRPARAVQEAKQLEQAQLAKVSPKSVTTVTSTADALESSLAENNEETRMSLSIAARNGARALAKMPGEDVVRKSGNFKDITTAAGHLHGWGNRENDAACATFVLSIGGNVNLGKQTVERSAA